MYSIERLARVLLLGRYSREKLMGLFYAAYFDASGKRDGYPILTVAGAVAPVKKWIRFEKRWTEVLRSEGVSEFHATDFAAGEGEFRLWKDDKVRRSAFLKRLVSIIRDNTNKLFSVSIELDAWKKVDSEYPLTEGFYSPYSLAAFEVINQTLKWAKRKRVKTPEFIFEEGDDGWEGLLKLCSWDNVTPIRLPKAKAIPCQVGDMLAWKCRITATNSIRRLEKMERFGHDSKTVALIESDLESLTRLQVRPGTAKLFVLENLRNSCKLSNFPRRDGPIILASGCPISHC